MGQGRGWGCALCHSRVAELCWSASGVTMMLGSSRQWFHEDVLSEVPPQVTSSAVTSCCQAYELHISKLSHVLSPGCSCLFQPGNPGCRVFALLPQHCAVWWIWGASFR
ncbi:hypothetical protein DV515_00008631, partial [Chloebia gouldiae]